MGTLSTELGRCAEHYPHEPRVYADANIPRFPFKPALWFEFKTWIWGSALGFSTLFCILGGYLPARRAAKMEPAQALAQN